MCSTNEKRKRLFYLIKNKKVVHIKKKKKKKKEREVVLNLNHGNYYIDKDMVGYHSIYVKRVRVKTISENKDRLVLVELCSQVSLA